MKYGWEIADEVQRFSSNTSELQFIEKSAYDKLDVKLIIAVEALTSIAALHLSEEEIRVCGVEVINDTEIARYALKDIEGIK